jgi:hypothetical protein
MQLSEFRWNKKYVETWAIILLHFNYNKSYHRKATIRNTVFPSFIYNHIALHIIYVSNLQLQFIKTQVNLTHVYVHGTDFGLSRLDSFITCSQDFYIIWVSNLLTIKEHSGCYSRNTSFSPN